MKTISFESPAENWEEAFAAGNGRLGVKVYGTSSREVFALNEESVWSSAFTKRCNAGSRLSIEKIKSLALEGKKDEALYLASHTMLSSPLEQAVYVSAGNLIVEYFGNKKANPLERSQCYHRELDLESGIITTNFLRESTKPSTADFSENTSGSSISYSREVFVSSPANVIIIHMAASTPRSISFRAHFERGSLMTKNWNLGEDTIAFSDNHGVPFTAMATAVNSGGSVSVSGGSLLVEDADEVTLIVDIQTAYRIKRYAKNSAGIKSESLINECTDMALKNISFASVIDYIRLKAQHSADYSYWFNKTSLELENKKLQKQWDFEKYLFISSSKKPGTLPVLKCGLWTQNLDLSNGMRYELKDDLKNTYGFTNMFSMSGLEAPVFNLLKAVRKHGKKTAQTLYSSNGFVCHTSTDLWGDSAPCGNSSASLWPLGGANLALLERENYEYTFNKKDEKKNYKLLRDCCRFFASYKLPFLQEDSDRKILKSLFEKTIKICEEIKGLTSDAEIALFKEVEKQIEVASDSVKTKNWQEDYKKELEGSICTELKCDAVSVMTKMIAESFYDNNKVTVSILPGVCEDFSTGVLNGLKLKGNLRLDISWKDCKIESAKITAPSSKKYVQDLQIIYLGKTYDVHLDNKSIDLLNVLPTTV